MKYKSIYFLAVAVLSIALSVPAFAQQSGEAISKDKMVDIKKMINIDGSVKGIMTGLPRMIQLVKRANPEIPESVWQDILAEFTEDFFIELLVPIYDKHLTHEEIEEIIAFYESPGGKKYVSIRPQVEQEVAKAAQLSLARISQKILDKYENETKEKLDKIHADSQMLYKKLSEKYGEGSVDFALDENQNITVNLIDSTLNTLKQEELKPKANEVARYVRENYPHQLNSIEIMFYKKTEQGKRKKIASFNIDAEHLQGVVK